jgi:hypothetical protein
MPTPNTGDGGYKKNKKVGDETKNSTMTNAFTGRAFALNAGAMSSEPAVVVEDNYSGV